MEIQCFIAYDCNHDNLNVTKISLSSAKDCKLNDVNLNEELVEIEVIQVDNTKMVHVFQCKINIIQTIHICGYLRYYSKQVAGGLRSYIEKPTAEQCLRMHKTKMYSFSSSGGIELQRNASSTGSRVLIGSLGNDGSCTGGKYSYKGATYEDAVVQQAIEVTLTDYYVVAMPSENTIVLRSGISCSYKEGECMDNEAGFTMWDFDPKPSCMIENYNAIFQGPGNRTYPLDNAIDKQIYTIHAEGVLMSLRTIKRVSACGYPAFQTEHPQLLIVPRVNQQYLFTKKAINKGNFDIFTYMNNKFVYIERHIERQLTSMYRDIMNDRCEKSKEIMDLQLAIGMNHPEQFAKIYAKQEGYNAIRMGDVIHVIQCQPVDVKTRVDAQCWDELPVTYDDKPYFMSPQSHILKTIGTPTICSSVLPSMYRLGLTWYVSANGLKPAFAPKELDPNQLGKWSYEQPGDMAKAGIVPYEDIVAMNRVIMFNINRQSIGTSIAFTGSQSGTEYSRVDLTSFLDEKKLTSWLSDHFFAGWGFLKDVGSIGAGFFVIYFIITRTLWIFGVCLRMKTRYDETGLSWKLLYSFWNDLSYYRDHKATKRGTWRYRQPEYLPKALKNLKENTIIVQSPSAPCSFEMLSNNVQEESNKLSGVQVVYTPPATTKVDVHK